MSDKANYGYLAGIIDGEGCITISKNVAKARKADGSDCITYTCCVGARNTDKRLMNWLQQHFKGEVYPSKAKQENWKPSYNWQLFGNEKLKLILLSVLPYLQLKREQAKVALEFLRLDGARNPAKRQELYEHCKKLNQRGVTVTTNTLDSSVFIPEWSKPEEKIEPELIGNNESAPDVSQGSEKCGVPPIGWQCSRTKGHDGPCAARPDSDLA